VDSVESFDPLKYRVWPISN